MTWTLVAQIATLILVLTLGTIAVISAAKTSGHSPQG